MDAGSIREVFAELMPVRVRRMFGGHGIYDGERMFALEAGGELYLKTDALTQGRFVAAGSAPFTYHKQGRAMPMSYWRLPEAALDDLDMLREWTGLALEAAGRAAKSVRRRG